MKHWLTMLDYSPDELSTLVDAAREIKRASRARGGPRITSPLSDPICGKLLGMVFFNPSLRTRMSFESAMLRFGGNAMTLNVGGDAWNLEHRDGVVMDGAAAEHIREAAPVLSRYCDALAVRTFAGLKDPAEDASDAVIRAFAKYATVPLINLESAMEHPCQGLADWLTIAERFGTARGRSIVVTWAPQAKPVPMAVPHSAILMASAAGMNVTLAHPPGYDLHPSIVDRVRSWCASAGSRFAINHDQASACSGADVVYVKSWGSTRFYGDAPAQQASFKDHASWMVTPGCLTTPSSILMHCLPVRRNVVIADAALNDPRCVVVEQAENRMWAQAAILARVFSS